MKRNVGILVGLTALGVAVYLSTQLKAQPTAAPHLTSKVAVLNLPMVIKNYKKYQVYEEELKAMAKKFQGQEESFKNQLTAIQNNTTLSAEAKEAEVRKLKRQAEDIGAEFKKTFSAKQEQQLVTLYSEVENMVKRYALARGFEMVLQYADAEPKEAHNPMVIQRKVLDGRSLPIYAADGLDITVPVYQYLNAAYSPAAGPATAPAVGAGH